MKKIIIIILLAVIAYKTVRFVYLKPKLKQGDTSITFSTKLKDGSDFNFSSLRNQYLILDFWGSWCGPCRRDNPKLVELYSLFHGKKFSDAQGFEIVSIGIENSESSWKRAIENDGLIWKYHILQDQNFDSPIAELYGVKEIPTKYLIDTHGKVLMTNPSQEQIISFLNGKLVSQ